MDAPASREQKPSEESPVYVYNGRDLNKFWRRGKRYSYRELRWLAKKRGLVFKDKDRTRLEIVDKADKPVAVFTVKRQSRPDEASSSSTIRVGSPPY